MKRALTIISYCMSALALVGLVACNKTPVNPSPDFDPETNTVKAKFVLSVSTNSPSTKMPASTVQVDGNGFRGLDKVHMLTFSLKNPCVHGDYFMYNLDDNSSKVTRDYDLGSLVTAADITADKHSRTVELAVPLSVNAIMLYGIASKTGSDDAQGAVISSGSVLGTNMAPLSFQLQNRLKDENAVNGFEGMCNLLSMSLTCLTDATMSVHTYGPEDKERDSRYAFWWPIDETSKKFAVRDDNGEPFTSANTPSHPGYSYHTGSVSWQDMGANYSAFAADPAHHPLNPLEQVIGRGYVELTNIRTKGEGANQISELRAGDAASLLRTLQDLSELVERTANAVSTGWEEEVARLMAEEIRYRLQVFFNWSDGTVQYRSMGDILRIAEIYFKDYETKIGKYHAALTAGSNGDFFPDPVTMTGGFPTNLNLPRSAALLSCARAADNRMVFSYLDAVPAYGMGSGSLPIINYRFPPELIYWANSGIRVSDDATDKLPDIPQTVSAWAEERNWSSQWTPNGTISSTTRSVALMKQVNYGTALLKSTVQIISPTLIDNKHEIFPEEESETITIGSTSFKVTGICIGGIQDVVGWDFTRKTDNLPAGMASNPYDKMIYDKLSQEVSVSTSVSSPMYTLVWDSYRPKFADAEMTMVSGIGEQDDQASIYVALELVNNTGKDFWGELNLIRNGGTFYLVGKLDIKDEKVLSKEIAFPDEKYFHYPPFYDDGQTVKVKRIFMQDFMTEAKFQIGRESLKHAYMTIPDLRSSQISCGLSVDLEWEEGLDFEVLLGATAD